MRYPLFLDLTGEPVTIVGAGNVAERKIRSLLAAKANVTVISPVARAAIRRLAVSKRVRWVRRRYAAGDLRGARLAVAATDDLAVNVRVCAEAKKRRLLVNCIAPPAEGNFTVPSLVRRGEILIAISTGGASPSLSKQLRRELEQVLGDRYAQAAQQMRLLRDKTKSQMTSPRQRRALYRRAVKRLLANS